MVIADCAVRFWWLFSLFGLRMFAGVGWFVCLVYCVLCLVAGLLPVLVVGFVCEFGWCLFCGCLWIGSFCWHLPSGCCGWLVLVVCDLRVLLVVC